MISYEQIDEGGKRHLSRSSFKNKFGYPKVHIAAFTALLVVIALGLAVSYTATASVSMMDPKSPVRVSPYQVSWIASLISVGAMVGGPASGYLSHKLGRKSALMYTSLPHVFGWLMVAYANSVSMIYAGRFIIGFCCGIGSVTVPTYIAEIAPPKIRGFLGTWFNGAFSIGVLLSVSLGSVLPWTWLSIAGAVIVVCLVFLLFFMPESPHWLIARNNEDEAIDSLEFLWGSRNMDITDFRSMVNIITKEPKQHVALKEFLEPILYKPVILSVTLMFFQQFCGINALMSYTVHIFQNINIPINPNIATSLVAATQVISTVFASILMDKAGRRVLLMISGTFGSIGLAVIGLFGYFAQKETISSPALGWLPVCGFMLFIFAFALGYGPIPWIVSAEMVPTRARSAVVAIASFTSNLFMFIVVKTFVDLRVGLHGYGVYLLYSCFSLIGCLFTYIFLPETKGKNLEDIQDCFLHKDDKNPENALAMFS